MCLVNPLFREGDRCVERYRIQFQSTTALCSESGFMPVSGNSSGRRFLEGAWVGQESICDALLRGGMQIEDTVLTGGGSLWQSE
jgi:hypothetical protein